MQTVVNKVKSVVYGHGRGWCLIPAYFRQAGTDASVRKALSVLHKQGIVRRLTKGIYDYPVRDAVLGVIPPDVDKVARAYADKNKIRIQPSGAYAANLLGFDDQVPARVVFLTDGNSKKMKVGNTDYYFRKTSPKNMALAGMQIGMVIQALRHIGKDNITPKIEMVLRDLLNHIDPKEIKLSDKFAPSWVSGLIRRVKDGGL